MKPWAQALRVAGQNYSQWNLEAPDGLNFTYWCLETNKINQDEYLSWARDHYGLASLNRNYFEKMPDIELLERTSTDANWSQWLLPICEWDGVIFVACVEPLQDQNWSFPVQFVLAESSEIKKYWDRIYQSHPSHTDDHFMPIESSDEILEINENGEDPLSGVISLDDSSGRVDTKILRAIDQRLKDPEATWAEDLTQSKMPSDQASANIVDLGKPESKVSSDDLFPSLPDEIERPPDLQGLDLNIFNDVTKNETEDTGIAAIKLNFDLTKSSYIDSQIQDPSPSLSSPTSPTSSEQFEKPFNQDEIPTGVYDVEKLRQQDKSEMEIDMDLDGDKENDQRVAVTPTTSGESHSSDHQISSESIVSKLPEAPRKIEDCKSEDELFAWAFREINTKYHCSMALLYEGTKLRPWKWDDHWRPTNPKALEPFDIASACIFRVVRRTHMPYHGYIIKNEINSQFFANWGLPELPSHVTITPLQYDSHQIGMILSIGSNEANSIPTLTHHEKVSFRLTEGLQKMAGKAA
jgi:hypothetical protein